METKRSKVKVANKIKPGDCFFLPAGAAAYYTRSHREVALMYEDDRRCGNTMGDDGESRVYSQQGSFITKEPTILYIQRLNGVEWHGYCKKPVGLVRATITSGPHLGRTVGVYRQDLHAPDGTLQVPRGSALGF